MFLFLIFFNILSMALHLLHYIAISLQLFGYTSLNTPPLLVCSIFISLIFSITTPFYPYNSAHLIFSVTPFPISPIDCCKLVILLITFYSSRHRPLYFWLKLCGNCNFSPNNLIYTAIRHHNGGKGVKTPQKESTTPIINVMICIITYTILPPPLVTPTSPSRGIYKTTFLYVLAWTPPPHPPPKDGCNRIENSGALDMRNGIWIHLIQ